MKGKRKETEEEERERRGEGKKRTVKWRREVKRRKSGGEERLKET